MDSSSISCGGQNSLEAGILRPNSPFGERINDDEMVQKFAQLVKYMILILGTVENDVQLCLDTILFLTINIFKGAGLSKVANCH